MSGQFVLRVRHRLLDKKSLSTAVIAMAVIPCCTAAMGAIRVATYNIDCSDQGNNNNLSGIATVVAGIGSHHINGNAQPVDVLALEELLDTNNNSITSTSLPILV